MINYLEYITYIWIFSPVTKNFEFQTNSHTNSLI